MAGLRPYVVVDTAASASAACGDGKVSGVEACDPPTSGYCSEVCQLIGDAGAAVCGNGAIEGAEECDDGDVESMDGCSSSCRSEVCGNARIDPGETCDHPGETCSVTCEIAQIGSTNCGNSTRELDEECDDGNAMSGDGCSAGCLAERCGNARLDQAPGVFGVPSVETCDPPEVGYCDATCQLTRCGDGVVASGQEECEPPGSLACDLACRRIECGNGALQAGEQCDDGNRSDGDGCNEACRSEGCGNGQLDANEDCEPPGTPRCDSSCRSLRVECGDGVLQEGEACDDANVAFGDGCSPTCEVERCGNERIEAPFETCEPPGTPACGRQCRRPICGDDVFDSVTGEQCEDNNLEAGDGCSPSCRFEVCGNGVLDLGEHCEPPGTESCDQSCLLTNPSGEGPLGPSLPVGAPSFQLVNPSFEGSLEAWELTDPPPTVVQFSPVDLRSAPTSGSAQLSMYQQSPVVSNVPPSTGSGDPTASTGARRANLAQCVRTQTGLTYYLTVNTRVPGHEATPVPLALGARFYPGPDCSGRMISGVSTSYLLEENRWSVSRLPPTSPIPSHEATFEAPRGAMSMLVWIEVAQEPLDIPSSALVDSVELVKTSPVQCGDGIPESPEECEPSVTDGCTSSCRLPLVCGDGLAAAAECSSGACPQDCGRRPPVCGDGLVTAPEECEPAGVGSCRDNCTRIRTTCGDGRVEGGETCDPPNGASCSLDCLAIRCGDGDVEPPEDCDPPGEDGCSRHCRWLANQPATCNDGLLQGDEECDPPNPETWCTSTCQRMSPVLACGDGDVNYDLGEECDPPGFDNDCGADCRNPVCGDRRVSGAELCDPPDAVTCGADCQLLGEALDCQECLATECRGTTAADDLFAACFGLEGAALVGPALGTPLRQLCADAVECMRETGCAAETRGESDPNPAACYCGKAVLTTGSEAQNRLRACVDGAAVADGPCRSVFERAAESVSPGAVLAALDATFSNTALSAAVQLMSDCGHTPIPNGCEVECSVESACGNGVVEPGELCEPALNEQCAPEACAILPCGNGVVDTEWPYPADHIYQPPAGGFEPETCDIQDPYTRESCDDTCQLLVTCGDGDRNPNVEACDPGGPGADWSNCCQPNTSGFNAVGQLASCDHDGNGQIGRDEQCQVPYVCGNGIREGVEQCDPEQPDPASCNERCQAVDPCTECTRRECSTAHQGCFEALDPGIRTGCSEVLECVDASGCGLASVQISVCSCGDRDPGGACQAQGGNGPCADVIARHSNPACGYPDAIAWGCVINNGADATYPAGAAWQVINCRKRVCAVECNYMSYPVVVDE